VFDNRTIVLTDKNEIRSKEVKMSPTATAIVTPDAPSELVSLHSEPVNGDGVGLNTAWAQIVQSVTNGVGRGSSTITVDLEPGESAQEFSTRLRLLILVMNRDEGSVSATVSPSFRDDTYPAMLDLVKALEGSGVGDDWHPDGPRSIRMGKAKHLFVSIDVPVADRSASPDTLIEIVAAHRIGASWYDQRVLPRTSTIGLTTVMFGVPNSPGSEYADSIFKRERTKNLSGRVGGTHFSRQLNWPATAAV
jgi:hypothetical protein